MHLMFGLILCLIFLETCHWMLLQQTSQLVRVNINIISSENSDGQFLRNWHLSNVSMKHFYFFFLWRKWQELECRPPWKCCKFAENNNTWCYLSIYLHITTDYRWGKHYNKIKVEENTQTNKHNLTLLGIVKYKFLACSWVNFTGGKPGYLWGLGRNPMICTLTNE